MKISFSLRRLWLFQTVVACLIGGWFAWQKWNYLFDSAYWQFEAFNEQLSSIPLEVGDWHGRVADRSRFSDAIREHYPPAYSSRVYRDTTSAEELIVYLVAGSNIKDMVQMHPLVGQTNGYEALGDFELRLDGESAVRTLRADFFWTLPDWQRMKLGEPKVCVSTMCRNGDWGLPKSFKRLQEEENYYRVLIVRTAGSRDVASEETKAAIDQAAAFASELLPRINDAIFEAVH